MVDDERVKSSFAAGLKPLSIEREAVRTERPRVKVGLGSGIAPLNHKRVVFQAIEVRLCFGRGLW